MWKDPEGYFDNIVWPAYELAHKGVFTDEDVEKGHPIRPKAGEKAIPGGPVEGLHVLDADPAEISQAQGQEGSSDQSSFSREMTQLVDQTCAEIWDCLTSRL